MRDDDTTGALSSDNELTDGPARRLTIEDVAKRLDYLPDPAAARLAAGRTGTVTVAVPSLNGWYFSTIVAGAEAVCAEAASDSKSSPFPVRRNATGGAERRLQHERWVCSDGGPARRADAADGRVRDVRRDGDHEFSRVDLTTIHQPVADHGSVAARLLIAAMSEVEQTRPHPSATLAADLAGHIHGAAPPPS
jgi:hypothetical protein